MDLLSVFLYNGQYQSYVNSITVCVRRPKTQRGKCQTFHISLRFFCNTYQNIVSGACIGNKLTNEKLSSFWYSRCFVLKTRTLISLAV